MRYILTLIGLYLFTGLNLASAQTCSSLNIVQTPTAPVITESQTTVLTYSLTNPGPGNITSLDMALPAGIQLLGVTSYSISSGTVTVTPSTLPSANVTFTVAGWAANTTLTLNLNVLAPCVTLVSTNGYTAFTTGSYSACTPTNPITVSNASIQFALSYPTTTTILKNTGDEDWFVYRVGVNSGVFSQAKVDVTAATNISMTQYYISTNSTINNLAPTSTIVPTITLTAADFTTVGDGDGLLEATENIYIHFKYKTLNCNSSSSSFVAHWESSNFTGAPCEVITLNTTVDVPTVTPVLKATNMNIVPMAGYCGNQNTVLGFTVSNTATVNQSQLPGSARANKIQFYVYADQHMGSINTSTVKVNNVLVPSSAIIQQPNQGNVQIYKIDFALLPVSNSNRFPFGANTLGDYSNDGFVDELLEGQSFNITVDYTYTSSCPPEFAVNNNVPSVLTTLALQFRYQDQCQSLPAHTYDPGYLLEYDIYGYQPFSITNTANAGYSYMSEHYSSTLTLPSDILENVPFTASFCPAYIQRWYDPNYSLGCTNPTYQMRILLPPGYYLYDNATNSVVTTQTFTVTYLDTYCSTNSVTATATATEYLQSSGNYIIVTFPNVPTVSCNNDTRQAYRINCFNLSFTFSCNPSQVPSVNFYGTNPDVFTYALEYVCDQSCSCVDNLAWATGSAYHHCIGACASEIGTTQTFTMTRATLGYLNPDMPSTTYYTSSNPTPVNPNTTQGLRLDAAYPGDEVVAKVEGEFGGTPSAYSDVSLQIRYDVLVGACGAIDIFDFIQTGSKIDIYDGVTNAFVSSQTGLTYTYALVGGVLEMDFHMPSSFFNTSTVVNWKFKAEIHLRVKTNPPPLNNYSFCNYGAHPLVNLRAEYHGLKNSQNIRSCDHWGAPFQVLQPETQIWYNYPQPFINECGPTSFDVIIKQRAALEGYGEDFPNEFKPYHTLDRTFVVKIPPGYTYVSSVFEMQNWSYVNNISVGNVGSTIQQYIQYPITLLPSQINVQNTGTTLTFQGLDPNNSLGWPMMDLLQPTGEAQIIHIYVQPTCAAPPSATVDITTANINMIPQAPPSYQLVLAQSVSLQFPHTSPNLSVINAATTNTSTNQIQFNFQWSLTGSTPAPNGWIALENNYLNNVNLVDFSQATAMILPNTPLQTSLYTTNSGATGMMVYVGNLMSAGSLNLQLTNLFTLGCPNTATTDYLNVTYGYSCSPIAVSSSNTSTTTGCELGTTTFTFTRYPADINLLMTSAPSAPVDLCTGLMTYTFEIENARGCDLDDPLFWMEFPAGVSFSSADLSYTDQSQQYAINNVLNPNINSGYGQFGTGQGWDLEQMVIGIPSTGLPGAQTAPSNKIYLTIKLKIGCGYVPGTPIEFFASGIGPNTNLPLVTSVQFTPVISNVVTQPAMQLAFPSNTINVTCSNSSQVVLNVSNLSNYTASNNTITVNVPYPLTATNISNGGTFNNNQVTWVISSITPQTLALTFNIAANNQNYCGPITLTANWSLVNVITCPNTAPCSLAVASLPTSLTIPVCCYSCTANAGPDVSICSGSTTTLTATGGVSYVWQPGNLTGSSIVVSPSSTTTYTVTATAANNAVCTDVVVVTVLPTPVITINPTAPTACIGGNADHVIATATGGTGPYTYSWSPSVSTTGNGSTALQLPAGNYTVTATDANGCVGTLTFTVTQIPATTVSTSTTNVNCYGACTGAIAINVLSGAGPYTYSWSPSVSTSNTASNLCSGTYSCTISDVYHCEITLTFNITQPPALNVTATAGSPNTSCTSSCNGTATVSVSGGTPGYTYAWLPNGSTAQNPTNLCAGTHTVTVTDSRGCTATRTVTIASSTLSAVVTSNIPNTRCTSPCNGSASVLGQNGVAPYTYLWSTGATTTGITAMCAGTYTCTVTDAIGCAVSIQVTITNSLSYPTVLSITSTPACYGGNNGTATVNVVGSYSYNWTPGNPTGDGTTIVTGLTAGIWTCTVTNTVSGCAISPTVTVLQPTAPITATFNPTSVSCNGGTNGAATITASGGTPGYNYNWTPGNPTGDGTAIVSGLTAGTWSCTVTDTRSCSSTFTVAITQPAVLSGTVTGTSVSCFGGSNGTATVTATGGTPSYSYNWAPGNPTGEGTTIASGLTAGTWSCTITDVKGCTTTKTVSITQPPLLSIQTIPCKVIYTAPPLVNGSVTLTATISGGILPYNCTWSMGSATNTSTTTTTSIAYSSLNVGANTVTLTVTDNQLCVAVQSYTIYKINNNCTLSGANPGAQVCYQGVTYCVGYLPISTYNSWMTAHPGATQGACAPSPCLNARLGSDSSTIDIALEPTLTAMPNPSNDVFMLNFAATQNDEVNLVVYDMTGQLVQNIYSGSVTEGAQYTYVFNGSSLASGMYIAKLVSKTTGDVQYVKLLLQH